MTADHDPKLKPKVKVIVKARLPFVIDAVGRFPPAQVRIAYTPDVRPSTTELDALIAVEWERQTALARETGQLLFNGELLRYVRHTVKEAEQDQGPLLELAVGPTCYRDFVGTNLYNHHRLEAFGWHRFANPIGTTATLLTCDDRICTGRRSARVAYHAGHVHTFGGALEARDRTADGALSAFDSVRRELWEELSLRREELIGLCCVGLIRDKEIHQPEMLFEARLDMTADDLRRRWETAEAKDEHDEVVSIADAPEALGPFIQTCGPIAPVAVGALCLHGFLQWGETWYSRMAEQIAP